MTYNISKVAKVEKFDEVGTVTWIYDGPKVGHDWPWTVVNPDSIRGFDAPASFNATPIIMDWFRNFTLPYVFHCPMELSHRLTLARYSTIPGCKTIDS